MLLILMHIFSILFTFPLLPNSSLKLSPSFIESRISQVAVARLMLMDEEGMFGTLVKISTAAKIPNNVASFLYLFISKIINLFSNKDCIPVEP